MTNNKVSCLCLTLDDADGSLGVSKDNEPLVSASEDWLSEQISKASNNKFGLLDLEMGDLLVTITVERKIA